MEEETIITSEKPSSDILQLRLASRSICPVCQKQFSQYTCPRCNIRYCSLHCYKSHNLRCTESFMRENVVDELKQLQADDDSKRRMLHILRRFRNEDDISMEENEVRLSEETIQKVLSGAEVNYDELLVEERKLFQRAMTSGELSKMIKPWDPWWLKPFARTISLGRDGTQLVQPIGTQEEDSSPPPSLSLPRVEGFGSSFHMAISDHPAGPETPLPPVRNLSFTGPSPLIAVHLVDILYSYCFTLRLYNGDWRSDPAGTSITVLGVSNVLGCPGQGPGTVLEAVAHCLEQACSPEWKHIGGLKFGFGVLDDVASLLSLGGKALVCALCDTRRMLQAALKEVKIRRPKRREGEDTKNKVKLAERKVYFVMCWVNEQMEEVWCPLSALVKAEKASFMEYQGLKGGGGRPLKAKESASNKSKVLLEEVQ